MEQPPKSKKQADEPEENGLAQPPEKGAPSEKERKGKEREEKERKGKVRKSKAREGKERKGKRREGKER